MSNTNLDEKKDVVEHVEVAPHLNDVEASKPKYKANTQMDDAARILEEAGGHVEYTKEESKRILRRIDLWVCIPMCM